MNFPILAYREYPGAPGSIPLALIAPHEKRAQQNHSQTLKRLAERGGLSPDEAVAVLDDRPWRKMDPQTAVRRLLYLVEEFNKVPA